MQSVGFSVIQPSRCLRQKTFPLLKNVSLTFGEETAVRPYADVDRPDTMGPPSVKAKTKPGTAPRKPSSKKKDTAPETPFDTYLREINEVPLLSAKKEKALARRVQAGDQAARDHLIRANLRLVVNIARRFVGKGLSLPDLAAEGNLGLLHAVRRFDPERNIRFSTYATYWIKDSIQTALINQRRGIRLPAYVVSKISKYRKQEKALSVELGRKPTYAEVATAMGLTEDMKLWRTLKSGLDTLDRQICKEQHSLGEEDDDILAVDAPSQEQSPEEMAKKRDLIRRVTHLLDLETDNGPLEHREKVVLILRYGLFGEEPHTLTKIGSIMGLTRERIRQIETDAVKKLQEHFQQSETPPRTLPTKKAS